MGTGGDPKSPPKPNSDNKPTGNPGTRDNPDSGTTKK